MSQYPVNMPLIMLVWFFAVYFVLFKHAAAKAQAATARQGDFKRLLVVMLFAVPVMAIYPNQVFLLLTGVLALCVFLLDCWISHRNQFYYRLLVLQTALVVTAIFLYEWLQGIIRVDFANWIEWVIKDESVWWYALAYILCLSPSNFLIKNVLGRLELSPGPDSGENEENLVRAGRVIGGLERIIILTLVIVHQYEAIGLLIAAKSIIRLKDDNRVFRKSEYILVGTLLSFCIAISIGMLLLQITQQ